MVPLFPGLLTAYLIGSIPTALLAGYIIAGIDIRTTGSKNAGATNLYRSFGLKPYILVLGFDIFKGYAAVGLLAPNIEPGSIALLQVEILCGVAAVFGHIFTIFARFRGGKGVATAAGMLLALIPSQLLAAFGVYLLVISITHYVSLGSISAAISIPVIFFIEYYLFGQSYPKEIYIVSGLLSILIVVTHRSNIDRLIRGVESKTFFFGKGR
jgi:glycerol-3-phosphate acyltransferase PlsY